MTTIHDITQDLQALSNQEERIEYLMDLGTELEPFLEEKKTQEHKVPGCISGVYIEVIREDDKIVLKATSESLIVKGLVKIFIEYFKETSKEEFLAQKQGFEEYIKEQQLSESVVATRANAITNMYLYVKEQLEKK